MAFLKRANATVAKSSLSVNDWNNVRGKSRDANIKVSSESLIRDYTPDKYLLTHCTIIASVDVDEEGPKNDREWPFFVTPETEQYVNNNEDCWERDLLLATYRTFIGGENYVEHIQIPELSKGKIVDAVARDVGDSIYVDILVATDRKHAELVTDIESGKISTLSMGCTVEYTVCTACGNVAEDDTKMCNHIKYQKGNHFYDKKGKRRKIAELCGHKSNPKSVKFIEASWVANPAFKGAVLRNILNPGEISEAAIKAAFEVSRYIDPDALRKAASVDIPDMKVAAQHTAGFDFPDMDAPGADEGAGDEGGGEEPAKEAPSKSDLDSLSDEVKKYIRRKVKEDLEKEITGPGPSGTGDTNETLVRSTYAFDSFRSKYASYGNNLQLYRLYEGLVSIKTAGWKSLKLKGFNGREILALSYFMDRERGVKDPLTKEAYVAISKVGGTDKYATPIEYLQAVAKQLGVKKMSAEVAEALIVKGQLYSLGNK